MLRGKVIAMNMHIQRNWIGPSLMVHTFRTVTPASLEEEIQITGCGYYVNARDEISILVDKPATCLRCIAETLR